MEEEKRPLISDASGGGGCGGRFWIWTVAAVAFRLILIYSFPQNLNLSSRPEVSTPITSLCRFAEGYWLKLSSMSPYSGSMYHGSPLLLPLLGPLAVKRIHGQPDHVLCSLLFVVTDVINAMLIRATGRSLQMAYGQYLKALDLAKLSEHSEPSCLVSNKTRQAQPTIFYWIIWSMSLEFAVPMLTNCMWCLAIWGHCGPSLLVDPFSIVACIGVSTSLIENLAVLLSIYGACKGLIPLAAFGWVMATHLFLYPAVLIVPVILLLGNGPDSPPRKLFLKRKCLIDADTHSENGTRAKEEELCNSFEPQTFSWRRVVFFLLWTLFWGSYVLVLCGLLVKQHGGLLEMFERTYGFILTVKDLAPNIGVQWYFFTEVFEFFRSFFLIVFHGNIILMTIPLFIRLKHRPCFLAFVCLAISSMFKSYPSVGDSALYLGLLALFVNELADFKFAFFLFCGYVGVSLLSPVMHNLWIWRGTGNANFYYATAMAYACFQIILIVESISTILNHDRKLVKLTATTTKTTKPADGKS